VEGIVKIMNLAKKEWVGRRWRWGEYWGSAIVD